MTKRIIALVLCYVVLAVSIVGCNASTIAADITDLETKLPQAVELATVVYTLVYPEDVPLIQPFAATLKQNADLVVSLLKQCSAAGCNATTLQGINAAVNVAVNNINNIVVAVAVKNPAESVKIQKWASIIALIFNDAAAFVVNHGGPAVVAQLPAFFGWHINGVMLLAMDGSQIPSPSPTHVKKSGYTARTLAKSWNNYIKKTNPSAQISMPKAHVLGVPVPFTGRK